MSQPWFRRRLHRQRCHNRPPSPGFWARIFGQAAPAEPRRELDDEMLEQLEEMLIQADMGVETALRVTANIAEGRMGRRISATELKGLLAEEIARIMTPSPAPCRSIPSGRRWCWWSA